MKGTLLGRISYVDRQSMYIHSLTRIKCCETLYQFLCFSVYLSTVTYFTSKYTPHTATMFNDGLWKKWKVKSENFSESNEEYERKTHTRQLTSETRF